MLQDHELFLQICERRGIAPPADVSNAIKSSSVTGELQLSCKSIMIPVCEIIAQMLASSTKIRSVDLSDCMLLPKGLNYISNALCEGSNVTALYLKGNNISGPLVAQLGQVFVHNNTLKRLSVAWNSLGSQLDSFAKFCDGLTKNHSLAELDLRYNQIHPSCAGFLCKVLQWNKTLRSLDLSWNTLGVQGGEMIMHAMQNNSNIITIGLLGNSISHEVLENIEERAYANRRRLAESEDALFKGVGAAQKFTSHRVEETDISKAEKSQEVQARLENEAALKLSQTEGINTSIRKKSSRNLSVELPDIKETEEDDSRETGSEEILAALIDSDEGQVETKCRRKRRTKGRRKSSRVAEKNSKESDSDLAFELSDTEQENSCSERQPKTTAVADRIKELNQILQDRTTTIETLTAQIATKDNELELVKSQMKQFEEQAMEWQEERERLLSEKSRDTLKLEKQREELEEAWKKKYAELEATYEKCAQGKREVDQKIRRYERDIHKSTMEISLLKEKLVSTSQAYEDLVAKDKTEMHRLRRESKEHESRHKIEINVLKNTLKDTTHALEECQEQLLKSRNELRELQGNYTVVKTKLTETELLVLRYNRLEETLQKVKEEKESLQEKLEDSQRTVTALQRQVAGLQAELIEPQRRHQLLKDELEHEKLNSERLRQELTEERSRLKDQGTQVEKMTQQLALLNTRINDLQNSHAEVLREKDRENRQLKETIARKEREFNELRAEEVQRAGQLYAAFSKYLGSVGATPVS